jgi:hypothetical protein
MALTIPTDSAALFWTQTTALDGVSYVLTFRYNSREQCYYLSIDSQDGSTNYVNGLKLVSNYLLLREVSTPPGELVVLAIGDDSPARVGDFGGGRCALYYIAQADVIASGAEPWRNPYA